MYTYKGKVTNVVDGDTIDVVIDLGFRMTTTQRLRLQGIDTPELRGGTEESKEKAREAKQFVIDKCLGDEVFIKTYKADSFGRYLAAVYIGNQMDNLAVMLVQAGYAEIYKK